jgi:transposase
MINETVPPCHACLIGVDVGKENLALHIAASRDDQVIPNQIRAIRGVLKQHPQACFVLEATGGYEMTLVAAALEAGHTVYRVNARRVRAFMESRGILAKTDAIDAKALADYAAANADVMQPFTLPSPEIKALRQLTRRRDELIAMRTQETNRQQSPDYLDSADLRADVAAVLKCLARQIESIENKVRQLMAGSPELLQKIGVMTAVKGIGTVTAAKLLAALPEIGTLTGKQIASLAGLAPHPRDSGKKKGYRRTGRGRKDVRPALFMAALSAVRSNADITTFYNRLLENGKKPLQALVAVARKLLVILNAKLRDSALKTA